MTELEHAARIAWVAWGNYAQWTVCADCNGWHYCRSRYGRLFLCLDCFDQEV